MRGSKIEKTGTLHGRVFSIVSNKLGTHLAETQTASSPQRSTGGGSHTAFAPNFYPLLYPLDDLRFHGSLNAAFYFQNYQLAFLLSSWLWREALTIVAEEGLENSWARHKKNAESASCMWSWMRFEFISEFYFQVTYRIVLSRFRWNGPLPPAKSYFACRNSEKCCVIPIWHIIWRTDEIWLQFFNKQIVGCNVL